MFLKVSGNFGSSKYLTCLLGYYADRIRFGNLPEINKNNSVNSKYMKAFETKLSFVKIRIISIKFKI